MTTDEIKQLIIQYAGYYGIDPGVAIAQAQRESGFRQDVIFGPTESADGLGCRGLMQFCKGTWAQYGVGDFSNAFDIYANLDAWGAYMSDLLNQFGGDYTKALMAYNGGAKWVLKGTPSQAAQNYAAAIVASYGTVAPSGDTVAQAASNGGGAGSGGGSSIPTWAIIGAVGLIAVFFIARD
jgi:soluble lytic murein transglycosylase-like protein